MIDLERTNTVDFNVFSSVFVHFIVHSCYFSSWLSVTLKVTWCQGIWLAEEWFWSHLENQNYYL